MNRVGETAAAFLESALRIRPGEGRRTAILFAHLLCASAVFILGRTVRDTLFLSRYPIRYLPWMFVLYGVVSALTVVGYARFADRLPRHRLIAGSAAVGIATYLATWLLVRAGAIWIYPAFYVWSEVVANLFIVQFWTLANDLHDARAAKRLFGTIGSARVLGVVLVGLGAGAAVRAIGTAQLLFVLIALMAAVAALARLAGGETRPELAARAVVPRRRGRAPRIGRDPYVRALALMILLIFVTLTIGDYQFKRIARDTFQEDDLARFFSLFYAGTGVASFLFQILLTPRILARLGVSWGLTVMPTVFGVASALLLAVPRLWVATVMKFADNGFQYTIHDTTLQALYVPFASEIKARTRAFLDAVVKPLSYGLGGLVLVLLAPRLAVGDLAQVTVPLTAAWLATIPLVKRRYRRQLEATLSARGALDADQEFLLDSEGRAALVRTLETGGSRQVLVALEQLAGERDPDVARPVERLAAHPDPVVRAAALMRLAATGEGDPEPARAALVDPVGDVRAAAAAAYAATATDEAVEALAPLLTDPAPDVRVAALAGLLKQGGVEGGIVGGAELGRLLSSGGREDLVTAARALRHLGRSAYRPLRRLLDDPDPVVRRAAAKAAPGVADPRLVPVLVALLADPACRQRAGQALVTIGEPALGPLAGLLGNTAVARGVQLEVPRLLRGIIQPASYALLRGHVHVTDSHLRLRVFAALSHLRRELNRGPEPLPAVLALVQTEMADADANTAGWTRARAEFASPLLDEEFALRRRRAVRRVLRILELRYDRDSLGLVRAHLAEPHRRANALEVLDTLLDPPVRTLVMPFVDDDLNARRGLPPAPSPVGFMQSQCRHPNPYVAALALDGLARHSAGAVRFEAEALLNHPDPLVREAARRTLAAVAGRSPEEPMYSTIEKILFLKSAPVFERVAGEDLAPLARVADVEVYGAGHRIFARGDPGEALFVITRGRVSVGDDGRTLATLGAGDTLGEMAVLDDEPRIASAIAVDEVEVLRIASEAFYEILHEQVEIAEGVIRMLVGRLREADVRLMTRRTMA